MANPTQRMKRTDNIRGASTAADNSYNEDAGGMKQVGPILGYLINIPASANTAVNLPDRGTTVAFYNNSASIAYAAFGIDNTLANPASFATGIPLSPNAWTVLAAGPNVFFKVSAATVGAFLLSDDTYLAFKAEQS
jgi:hypothetical protein